MSRIAEKVPTWVERLLIPTLESRVRTVVKEEVAHLEKAVNARFDAVDAKITSLTNELDAKITSLRNELTSRLDALEQRYDLTKDVAS